MKRLLSRVVLSLATIVCWGVYGPLLHAGRRAMARYPDEVTQFVGLRPWLCVGLAFFVVAVLGAAAFRYVRGEPGHWSVRGALWGLSAGAAGAIGGFGTMVAFARGGRPIDFMPLVFAGVPVIAGLLQVATTRQTRRVAPGFLAGLIMVLLGIGVVLLFKPAAPVRSGAAGTGLVNSALVLAAGLVVVVSWGVSGAALERAQVRMGGSRLQPFLGVAAAWLPLAVLIPAFLLRAWGEPSEFGVRGVIWSAAAGAAAALGVLALVLAIELGGRPFYLLPLVFGGAPVVNTLASVYQQGTARPLGALFLAGLILVVAGTQLVLCFLPGTRADRGIGRPAPTTPSTPAGQGQSDRSATPVDDPASP